jgi:hypothetical protein
LRPCSRRSAAATAGRRWVPAVDPDDHAADGEAREIRVGDIELAAGDALGEDPAEDAVEPLLHAQDALARQELHLAAGDREVVLIVDDDRSEIPRQPAKLLRGRALVAGNALGKINGEADGLLADLDENVGFAAEMS